MKSCHHPSFKWVRDEDLGDRVIKHSVCRACGHPRKRNVKKPRYTTRKPPEVQSPSKQPKTLQRAPTGKRKAIRAVSAKRKKELAEYSRLKAEFLMQNVYCEVFPNLVATEVHHGMGREGRWLLDTSHWHAVSRAGHEKIENEREWAAQQGYLKLRLTTDQLNHVQEHLPEKLA